jgi:bifunctional UDP-N-acetylglucosamine pyrophosphorylase/glucosamine-1-phosphate N-acetyltransferase
MRCCRARRRSRAATTIVLVLFGDTPLIEAETLGQARKKLAEGAAVAVIGFRHRPPDRLRPADREERRARRHPRGEGLHAGQKRDHLLQWRPDGDFAGVTRSSCSASIGNANAKGEYYLTDIVAIARAEGLSTVAIEAPFDSVLGVNNRAELAEGEAIWQRRTRRRMMLDGVTLVGARNGAFLPTTPRSAATRSSSRTSSSVRA